MKEEIILGANELKLFTYIYDASSKPKAVVLIIHGMQEHAQRYADFAKFLNENNFIVYISDLRGHGKTTTKMPGYDEDDIFELTLQDQNILLNTIKKDYKNLPIFVLGHSYGSFISQSLLLQNPQIAGLVLSGSTYTNTALYHFGKIMAGICGIAGNKKKATVIEKISIQGYGKKFENGNWLSRDNSVWEKYKNDEFCGNTFPISFYQSFFKHITKNYINLKNVNKNTPILLIGGTKDPVSNYSKGLGLLYKKYIKAGLNVELKYYKDSRHEVLNEINKQEVYMDILNFFNKSLN